MSAPAKGRPTRAQVTHLETMLVAARIERDAWLEQAQRGEEEIDRLRTALARIVAEPNRCDYIARMALGLEPMR